MSGALRRLLVAVDFSPTSKDALQAGIELARRFGAELHLMHAFDAPVPVFNPYAVSVPVAFVTEAREAAQRKLDEWAAEARDAGVEPKVHLAESPAASAITQVAETVGADWIVVGTRGHTGLKHVLLGSVAERTVRTAPCAVLTVKGTDAGAS